MSELRVIALIWLIAGVMTANADEKKCTKEDAIAAESVPFYIESWGMMHIAFKSYKHCDDGSIGEAFSDSIANLLSKHWDLSSSLEQEIKSDPEFGEFVLKHIDATVPAEELGQISELTKNKCSKSIASLCKSIKEQIENVAITN